MALTMNQLREYADMKMLMDVAKGMLDEMKAAVDGEFESRYLQDGTKTRDVLEDGEKLASLTWVPGTPNTEAECLLVDDPELFLDWCVENGCIQVDEDAALRHLHETGEMPAGCALSTKATRGRRGYVKVTPTKPYKAAFAEDARKLLGGGA